MKFSQPIDCKNCRYFSPGDTENPDYCDADGTEFNIEAYNGGLPDWCPLESKCIEYMNKPSAENPKACIFCKKNLDPVAVWLENIDPHVIWAAAQLMPGEGIEDGVKRIKELLR